MNGGERSTEKIRLVNLWSEVRFYGTDSRFLCRGIEWTACILKFSFKISHTFIIRSTIKPAYFVTWNTTSHRNLWTMVNDLIIENLCENEENKWVIRMLCNAFFPKNLCKTPHQKFCNMKQTSNHISWIIYSSWLYPNLSIHIPPRLHRKAQKS